MDILRFNRQQLTTQNSKMRVKARNDFSKLQKKTFIDIVSMIHRFLYFRIKRFLRFSNSNLHFNIK